MYCAGSKMVGFPVNVWLNKSIRKCIEYSLKKILYFFYFTVVCMFHFNSHLFLMIRFKIFSDKFQQCELHFGSWTHHKHEIDLQFFPRRGGNQSGNLLPCLHSEFILLVFDQYISLLFCTELALANFQQEGHQS